MNNLSDYYFFKEREMTKKLVLFLVVLAAFSALLFANGTNEKSATAAASDKPVTINLWYGAAVTEAGPIPDNWVGYQIIKDKLNIDLKLTALPSNASDQDVKIQASGAANNLPDVFMVNRPVLVNLVKQGLIAELDDSFYSAIPTRTEKYHSDPDSMNYGTINGKNYGMAIPSQRTGIEGLVIRKDWLDKLGLQVPTNLDELKEVLRAFTYDDPDGNGKNDTYGYGAFVESNSVFKGYPGTRVWPLMGAFDVAGLWSMKSETLGLNVFRPEFYDFMVFFKSLCDENLIDPNWLSYKKDDFRAAWKQGRFGVMYEQWAALSAESNYKPFDTNFPEGEWMVINPPVGPEGKSSTGALDKQFRIYAVSAKAQKEGKMEAIERLFEWMGTEEAYYLLGYGTEGVNYVFDENGKVSKGDLGDNSFSGTVGQVQTQLRNMVFFNDAKENAVRFPDYLTAKSKKIISPTTYLDQMGKTNWTSAVGSNSMPTPNADVFRFYEQSLAEFLTGARSLTPEGWAKFIDQFKAIGGEDWNNKGIAFAKDNGYAR